MHVLATYIICSYNIIKTNLLCREFLDIARYIIIFCLPVYLSYFNVLIIGEDKHRYLYLNQTSSHWYPTSTNNPNTTLLFFRNNTYEDHIRPGTWDAYARGKKFLHPLTRYTSLAHLGLGLIIQVRIPLPFFLSHYSPSRLVINDRQISSCPCLKDAHAL